MFEPLTRTTVNMQCKIKKKHQWPFGLQVPSQKVFGVGARRVQIPSQEVLGGVGWMLDGFWSNTATPCCAGHVVVIGQHPI